MQAEVSIKSSVLATLAVALVYVFNENEKNHICKNQQIH